MRDDRTPAEGNTTRQDIVTVTEAARRLNVTPDAIRARLRRGTIDGEKRGSSWYVLLPAEVDDTTQPGETVVTDPSRDATGAALVELLTDLTRRNAELAAAAAVWQDRAKHLEERLQQLEAGPITTAEAPGSPTPNETPVHGESVEDDGDRPTGGAWSRLVRWFRGDG